MGAGCDKDLTLRVPDQLGKLLAPIGGVDSDNDCARQGCPCQPEHIVGHVVEEYANVSWTVTVHQRVEQRGPSSGFFDELAVRPLLSFKAEGSCLVFSARTKDFSGCRHLDGGPTTNPGRGHEVSTTLPVRERVITAR